MASSNPIIIALITYGLTAVIAMLVAGIIAFIGWAVKERKSPKGKEAE